MAGKKVEYRLKKSGPWGAEWLVCQKDSLDDPAPPHARFAESAGFQYQFAQDFPDSAVIRFALVPLSEARWFREALKMKSQSPSAHEDQKNGSCHRHQPSGNGPRLDFLSFHHAGKGITTSGVVATMASTKPVGVVFSAHW